MSKKKTSDKKTALAESCVKVQVTIKTYSGIKADTKARNELADIKDANQQLVKVSKHLLKKERLAEPIKIGKKFRNQVMYKHSLPWIDADDQVLGEGKSYIFGDEGRQVKKGDWRLLPSKKTDWFKEEVKKYQRDFEKAVDKIINDYDDAIEEVRQKNIGLGKMFNRSDYLSPDELRARYVFIFEEGIINEFNSDDIRVQISANLKSNIISDYQEKENNVKKNADRHTAKKLIDGIQRLARGLEKFDPKNKTKNPLRDGSYNDLRDMLDSIDEYLLGDDDDLRSTVADLRKDIIDAKSQDNLKKDDKARKSTAKKLRKAEKQVKVSDTAKGLF